MNYSVQSIAPSYSFQPTDTAGTRFAARPLRHWRKQLQATNKLISYRRTALGIPSDKPGSTTVTTHTNCHLCNGAMELTDLVNKKAACASCFITRTAINATNESFTDSAAYLQSKCKTYEQKLAYNPAADVTYFSSQGLVLHPTDSPTGPQVSVTNQCYTNNKSRPARCNTTIYKPNNSQFASQGGVAAGTRIGRLKYNTLNNYGAEFSSAKGAVGVNTGRYVTEPSPSYYTKLKPQKVVYPYKNGAATYCRPEHSMCTND